MWRAKVYPTVVSKFLLVLVDLHNNLFIVRTQLRNANLSKYQPWPSIQVTDRTASPIQLNYTSSIWNQILGSKHHFQFFIFFEHCAMCTDQTVMHRPNRDAQTKLWCTDQTVMHRPNCDAQIKPWCTDQTVMHRSNRDAQTKLWCTDQTVSLLAQHSTLRVSADGCDVYYRCWSASSPDFDTGHSRMPQPHFNGTSDGQHLSANGRYLNGSLKIYCHTVSVVTNSVCGRILSVITGGKRWAGPVVRMEVKRNAHRGIVGRP
jgi:hypothetical protein